MREFLNSLDGYGRKKLEVEAKFAECEAYFNSVHHASLRVFMLRLPDVIGPFDDSYRMQKLVLWMKMLMEGKQCLPLGYEAKDLDQPLSLVFSRDVTDVIEGILFGQAKAESGVFNLACREQPLLPDLLVMVHKELLSQLGSEKTLTFDRIEDEFCMKFFPSVNCGPISIKKAQDQLGFSPTSLAAVLSETVKFCL